jgi:hypothetical protein
MAKKKPRKTPLTKVSKKKVKRGSIEGIRDTLDQTREIIALEKGPEYYVLHSLLKAKGLATKPGWNLEKIRKEFTFKRGEYLFGFYFEDNAWYTRDISRFPTKDAPIGGLSPGGMLSFDEKHATPRFLAAYAQKEGIKYEFTRDTEDFPGGIDAAEIVGVIDKARQHYTDWRLAKEGKKKSK